MKNIIEIIKEQKLIVIIRESDKEISKKIIDRVVASGIKLIEITMNSDSPVELINYIKEKYPDVLVGAGTVLDMKILKRALKAKVDFTVTPNTNKKVIKACRRKKLFFIPGVATLNEIYLGYKLGIRIFKLFPSTLFEPSIIKSYKSILNDIEIMPTGGINLDNAEDWLKEGAFVLGIGNFISKEAKETNNYKTIDDIILKLNKKVEKINKK